MSVTHPRLAAATAVLLPGTGSDDVFVRAVFEDPLSWFGIRLIAPRPVPGSGLVAAHLAALDAAALRGPVIVGGISLGAHLAAQWAVRNPERCAGLLLALPGWSGRPAQAPAALAAIYSAADVRARGTEAALASAVEGVAPWLADELRRAWTAYGPGLADSLVVAAHHPAPTIESLAGVIAPAGIVGCVDDPVHPVETARDWTHAMPHASLVTTTLKVIGADREALGRAAVLGLLRAGNTR
ncbi:MAG: alpha/beta hydrolase [Actinomycetota bacterium]|nr:alpha/beta hydrolase [Actinomycetota bacterium]